MNDHSRCVVFLEIMELFVESEFPGLLIGSTSLFRYRIKVTIKIMIAQINIPRNGFFPTATMPESIISILYFIGDHPGQKVEF